MAQKWNDRNLLKLLLLAVTDFKGDYAELASQWATRYPDEKFKPTARAIQEKLKSLKKAVDASSTATIKGSKWTEGHLLKLLMLATTNIKSNYAELATQWAKRYPDEPFKPTARAIQEKLKALKKTIEGPSSAPTKPARAQSTPSTPKKRATPTSFGNSGSSSKRNKQFDAMKLSSDTDSDEDILKTPSPHGKTSVKSEIRHTPSRRSKSATVSYSLGSFASDGDDDDKGGEQHAEDPTARMMSDLGGLPVGDDSAGLIKLEDGNIVINSRHVAGSARRDSYTYFDQVDDDTDVSNFLPEED